VQPFGKRGKLGRSADHENKTMTEQQLMKRVAKLEAQARLRAQLDRAKKPSVANSERIPQKVSDPLIWLQRHTKTKDPHWREIGAKGPYRAFPDKPYFRPIVNAIDRESVVFLAKSRDLMVSWLCVGYFTHMCMLTPGLEVLMQSQTEEKAAELIDYAKCLYDHSDEDIRRQHPLTSPSEKQSWLELNFANNSRLVGIPHGASKIRSYHPTALFIDEAAFVPDAGQSYDEAVSACQKLVVVSSAAPGWFESVMVSAE
jgi:hypothetical protein